LRPDTRRVVGGAAAALHVSTHLARLRLPRFDADRMPSLMPKDRRQAIAFLVLGPPLSAVASWYLFGRLRFHEAPGLLHHFPQVYLTLIGLAVSGVVLVILGLVGLRRHRG
jgi:hypothetical protein